MSTEELDFGEFNLYSGGFCLDLAPNKPLESVALFAEAINAQSGNITDKQEFVNRLLQRGEDDFTAVSLASVFVHEIRHFHCNHAENGATKTGCDSGDDQPLIPGR